MSFAPRLDLCDGPECTRCGCRDSKIEREPHGGGTTWWDSGVARCNHCGLRFYFRQKPVEQALKPLAVPAAPTLPPPPTIALPDVQLPSESPPAPSPSGLPCPECGQPMKVASTRQKFRWYKCTACGATHKTAR